MRDAPVRLRSCELRIEAPRELVFDLIASAGREVGETGEERLVEFETRWRGRVYKSTEAVCLERPHRIGYRWIMGPVAGVEEEINLIEVTTRSTQLNYHGSFDRPPTLIGWFRAVTVVRPIFNRLVRSHLEEAKKLAEARAMRSRIYPS